MSLVLRITLAALLWLCAQVALAQESGGQAQTGSDVPAETTASEAAAENATDTPGNTVIEPPSGGRLTNTAVPLYPLWEDVATWAEQMIDARDASNATLERMRARVVEFRTEFSSAREANAERIKTLQDQIDALGPVPENGEEAPEVREKRAELENRLETLLAPVRVAEAAFRRADGLITEIDSIIRERQARRLLSLGPSPLDPRNWPEAFMDTRRILADIAADMGAIGERWNNRVMRDRLPLVIFMLAVAITLLAKGRTWVARGIDYLRQFGGRGTGVWAFIASLFRVILPLIGLLLLANALKLTGLLGNRAENVMELVPLLGAILLGFHWLGEKLFSKHDSEAIIALPRRTRKRVRFYILLVAVFGILRAVLQVTFDLESAAPEAIAVLSFPLVVLLGAALAGLGLTLRRSSSGDGGAAGEDMPVTAAEPSASIARLLQLAANAMIAVGVIAPVMAAVGYAEAGNALLFPTILSIAVFGLVLVFQRFLSDVYGLLTGQGPEVREGLPGIFIGFFLILLSLPLLALVWGARVSDLTELWDKFLRGFNIGGAQIQPADFLAFLIIFAVLYTVTRLLQSTLKNNVLPKTRIDVGGQNAIVSGVGYIGIFLAALVAITVAGLDLSGLAIVAGALSVGIGFGLQTIVSNFVSGIILLIERPISEGDWIEVGGQMGYVKDISVRSTRIETFDRTDVIVPNSDFITGTVTNYTRGNTIGRVIVPVGVAYGTDTKKVDRILREIAEAHPMVLANPAPGIIFTGFGADALEFEIRAILRDVNWVLAVKNDINHEIAARFAEAGIEIPFAQRDIWIRNADALRGRADPPPEGEAEAEIESAEPEQMTEEDVDASSPGED